MRGPSCKGDSEGLAQGPSPRAEACPETPPRTGAALLSAACFAVTSTTQLRDAMLSSFPAEDLWKFVNATARDQYRVMVVIDGEGHGAPNSWLRLSSIVLYDITAALSSKSSRT